MINRIRLRIYLIAICLFLCAGCGTKKKVAIEKEAIPVKVTRVELKTIRNTLDYVGDIKAQDEALVYSRVSGKVLEKVKEDGSSVNKGEVIAYIDRDEVGFKFEKAPVESPLTGIIGRVYINIGSSVTPQTPIALVVNMDRVKISLEVPERYLPRMSLGQEAIITTDAYPGEEFIGRVTKISPVLSLETRSLPVEIGMGNNDHRLKSGMFARVKLVIEEHKNVPVILKEAIMGKDPDYYVYVAEKNMAIFKKITLGIREGEYFEVLAGVREGEFVVIMGQQRLRDKTSVIVEEAKEEF